MNDFQLSEADKSTSLWVRLRAHLQERLADLRVRNDAPQDEKDTASIRGEIRCLKKLIALEAVRPILTGED